MRARLLCLAMMIGCGGGGSATPDAAVDAPPREATFRVFDEVPQFGIYTSSDPQYYTPPQCVLMWSYGTVFVTKLSAEQKAQIGDQLAARITYIAQCDNYDRLGGLFFVVKAPGEMPQPTDPRVEVVRFITPFSNFRRGEKARHTYPDADISAFAHTLADPTKDIWFGIAGGSNPYDGDPCTVGTPQPPEFAEIGFKYTVELATKYELGAGDSVTLSAIGGVSETATPISGTFTNPGAAATGHVTVIVTGHGPDAGGNEYMHTANMVKVNGETVGTFSTMIDCAPYAVLSPDGNPGIFKHNTTSNPRNWCPGALVPTHTFAATLPPGESTVTLEIMPGTVPDGSYYWTSISFGAP